VVEGRGDPGLLLKAAAGCIVHDLSGKKLEGDSAV
jgi:hypothetical protein